MDDEDDVDDTRYGMLGGGLYARRGFQGVSVLCT